MKNCGDLRVDREVLFLESWYETARRSRITTTYGVFYSPDPPLTLFAKASMLFAFPNGRRIKATRHNLKEYEKNIILISTCGLAAYSTDSPCQLGCVWIFNHHYTLEAISPTRTRIKYERLGISKEVDASIHHLSNQRKRLNDIIS